MIERSGRGRTADDLLGVVIKEKPRHGIFLVFGFTNHRGDFFPWCLGYESILA
jgi:hypothetical protein